MEKTQFQQENDAHSGFCQPPPCSPLPAASSLLLLSGAKLSWGTVSLSQGPELLNTVSHSSLTLAPQGMTVSQVTLWAESRASWALTVVDEGT